MGEIKKVLAREILDSRGNPTVEVDLWLSDGSFGRAAVPSGASTGSHEAVELRDGDSRRYAGLGVLKAIANVNGPIAETLAHKAFDQRSLDRALIELDGTANKAKLGANAILGVSMAFAKGMAMSAQEPLYDYFKNISETKTLGLPVPMVVVLEGGKHADHSSDVQEFMLIPRGAASFSEGLRWCAEIYHAIGNVLKSKGFNVNVGYEGAYGPALGGNEKVLEVMLDGIKTAGYEPGKHIAIAIDAAASEFYRDGAYYFASENKKFTSEQLIALYEHWINTYPIISIEDGLAEDDWVGWKHMTEKLGTKIQIVGDDLFATTIKRLEKGIAEKSANAILIKLNQIGTVSETIDAVVMAKKAGFAPIISHRSGETEDTTIADFAVGVAAGQIKTGALCRSERVAKYNQLLRIEERLNLLY